MNKSVRSVDKHDWKKEPVRFDPSRGYLLCQSCWNGQHFNPPYRDVNNVKHPRTVNCKGQGCQCGCRPEYALRKPKFTHAGQAEISMANPLEIK